MNPEKPLIYQSGTSVQNMITMREFYGIVLKVAAYNKFEQQWAMPSLTIINNR